MTHGEALYRSTKIRTDGHGTLSLNPALPPHSEPQNCVVRYVRVSRSTLPSCLQLPLAALRPLPAAKRSSLPTWTVEGAQEGEKLPCEPWMSIWRARTQEGTEQGTCSVTLRTLSEVDVSKRQGGSAPDCLYLRIKHFDTVCNLLPMH